MWVSIICEHEKKFFFIQMQPNVHLVASKQYKSKKQ